MSTSDLNIQTVSSLTFYCTVFQLDQLQYSTAWQAAMVNFHTQTHVPYNRRNVGCVKPLSGVGQVSVNEI